MKPPAIFLTAEWNWLAMLNYEVAPEILAPSVPAGTELDTWQGKHLVSMVGFLFQKTRVRGIPIPFHRNFEEVNLRFYVRRKVAGEWRRGVVFIKELVPHFAIAWVARTFYNENYVTLPMSHRIENVGELLEEGSISRTSSPSPPKKEERAGVRRPNVSIQNPESSNPLSPALSPLRRGEGVEAPEGIKSVRYGWRFDGEENYLTLTTRGGPVPIRDGTEDEFITEHYWGYAAQQDGSTVEYHVDHPRWRVWETASATLHCDVAGLYGERFGQYLNGQPSSAFLAEGSAVKVFNGSRLVPEKRI